LSDNKFDFLIDTHSHIDGDEFTDDIEDIVLRAEEANIKKIVVPAIEPTRFQRLKSLTEKFEIIYQGIGIHPHSADKFDTSIAEVIENTTELSKTVAIGEIGLEYYYDFVPKKIQHEVFNWHLDLAAATGLPAIIHSREAELDCIEMFGKKKGQANGNNLKGVLHCFSVGPEILNEALDTGLIVSFTGNITFKKFAHAETIEQVPLDKFMIETDAPYMAPVPFRGKRNEPSMVQNVAKKIAELKSLSLEEVIHHSTKNAMEFFKFSLVAMIMLIGLGEMKADDRYEGYEDEDEEVDNSTVKSFGIGLPLGTNTIINKIPYPKADGSEGISSRSYAGLLALGVNLNYFVNRYIMVELSYLRSVNEEISNENANIDPYLYNLFLGQAHFVLNPNNPLQFTIGIGGGLINASETYSVPIEGTEDQVEPKTFITNKALLGGSFGVGYDYATDFGVLNLGFSFTLVVSPEDYTGNFYIYDDTETQVNSTKLYQDLAFSRYFSIPKLVLTYYPSF